MSITSLVVCSLITAIQAVYVFYSFDKHWLKVALGYKAYVDLFYSVGMTVYFALSGTISGIMMSTISGAMLSLSLLAVRKLYGYRKREERNGQKVWVEYKPEWTVESIKENALTLKDKVTTLVQKTTQQAA